jgi:tRNA pseudouridine38-40 synthase
LKEKVPSSDFDRNIKLTIEYDGTAFHGWQWQPNVRTVQGELQRSLKKIIQQDVILIGSGRTDVGVHALGQVANFHSNTELTTESILLGTNTVAARDVRIIKAEEVDLLFHARFDAKRRVYRYVISKRARAVMRQYAWVVEDKLDVEAMRKASRHLLGEHDFRSFCQAKAHVSHHLLRMESVEWRETSEEIIMEIIANRFLHHMVRIIVGTMVDVGRNKIAPDDVKQILQAKNRNAAGMTRPAQGLFLVRSEY